MGVLLCAKTFAFKPIPSPFFMEKSASFDCFCVHCKCTVKDKDCLKGPRTKRNYLTYLLIACIILVAPWLFETNSFSSIHITRVKEELFGNRLRTKYNESKMEQMIITYTKCVHGEAEMALDKKSKAEHHVFSEMLNQKKLMVYMLSFRRAPIIFSSKCGFTINNVNITKRFYRIGKQTYSRNVTWPMTDGGRIMSAAQDFHWLVKHLKNNSAAEWILQLEDDIQLCPSTIHAVVYLVNDLFRNDNRSILILLGAGATGLLYNKAAVPSLIQLMNDYFVRMTSPKFQGIDWKAGHDQYIVKHQRQFGLTVFLSKNLVIFHPGGKSYESTTGHGYTYPLKCRNVNAEWIRARDMDKKNVLDLSLPAKPL